MKPRVYVEPTPISYVTARRAAVRDAADIAIASANGVESLVAWNFRHIASAMMRQQMESACRQAGVESSVVCSRDELMEDMGDEE